MELYLQTSMPISGEIDEFNRIRDILIEVTACEADFEEPDSDDDEVLDRAYDLKTAAKIRIKWVRGRDYSAIDEMLKECDGAEIDLFNSVHPAIKAVLNRTAEKPSHIFYVDKFFVEPAFRKLGIGRKLWANLYDYLDDVLNFFPEIEGPVIICTVPNPGEDAPDGMLDSMKHVVEKAGFSIVEKLTDEIAVYSKVFG